jgi:hypothetical protein
MRVVLTLVLATTLTSVVSAQLPRPRDLANVVRTLPSLDRLMKNRPLETSFDHTLGQLRILDRLDIKRQPGDMKRLARTSNGSFLLQPGLWEATFESYCLRTATWAPGAGDGYLWAPIRGSRAGAISTILRSSVRHPNIPRGDIQMLLWAILSKTRVSEMPPKLQAAARALLPASEINAINVSGVQAMEIADRTRLFRGVTGPIKQALEIESDLRYEFSKANANYEQIERIAVLSGTPPPQNRNAIKRGQWSPHPGGYFVRYFPDSFANLKVQVLKPAPVRIERDQLNRIVLMEDSRGTKTEIAYNDAIGPRPHPTNKRLTAYAFKTVRITRRNASGAPEVVEYKDKGYTFHQSRPRRRGMVALAADGVRWALTFVTGTPLEARQGWLDWFERAEQAHELYEDGEYIRDRVEATTTTGDSSSVDEAGDVGHVRDGVIVIVVGDTSDRVGFITEMQENFNEMLEYAISVLQGLPDGSDTFDPGGGVAVPSGGGQTLGGSGR